MERRSYIILTLWEQNETVPRNRLLILTKIVINVTLGGVDPARWRLFIFETWDTRHYSQLLLKYFIRQKLESSLGGNKHWRDVAGPSYLKHYAVVTPLRKAASYEQRKTILGNQNFRRRIITWCHVLRSNNEGILVYRHVGDTTVESADFTWQNFEQASRRPRNYHVLPRRCRIWHELATYHPKSLKWLYVAHTRRLYAKVWPRHYS